MSKFIIISEGYRTEPRYFTALGNNRQIAGINSLIDIIILQREPSDAGCSCPKTILDLLDEYMSSVRCGHYSLNLVINSITNSSSLSSEDAERYHNSVTSLVGHYCDSEGFIKDENRTMDACTMLFKEMFGRDPVLDIPKLIDYRDDVDHVCVIVDRDKDSRSSSDLDEFIRRCLRSGYEPYISNPCFELWLLMHFEEYYEIERKKLLQNPMIDGKRFTERELDRIVHDLNPNNRYEKIDYDPLMFMHRVHDAVETSMTSCHDLLGLKTDLGTNLGSLLEKMSMGGLESSMDR